MEDDIKKVYVSGISKNISGRSFRDYFQNYGEVEVSAVIRDRSTGLPLGFGFVLFADPTVAARVIMESNHTIDGCEVQVKRFVRHSDQEALKKKIYVGRLQSTVTEQDLMNHFAQFGTVLSAEIVRDKITNRPMTYGFVSYDSEDAVQRALVRRFQQINNQIVEVRKAVHNAQYVIDDTMLVSPVGQWPLVLSSNGRHDMYGRPVYHYPLPSAGWNPNPCYPISRGNDGAYISSNNRFPCQGGGHGSVHGIGNHGFGIGVDNYPLREGRYGSGNARPSSYGLTPASSQPTEGFSLFHYGIGNRDSQTANRPASSQPTEGFSLFHYGIGNRDSQTANRPASSQPTEGFSLFHYGIGNRDSQTANSGVDNYPLREGRYGSGNASPSSYGLRPASSQPTEAFSLFHYGIGNRDSQTANRTASGYPGRTDTVGRYDPPSPRDRRD